MSGQAAAPFIGYKDGLTFPKNCDYIPIASLIEGVF
jgi:hypothetical protein